MAMFTFEVANVFFAAVAMSTALAHALEYPGKLRLDERTYRTVQTIYYPGFTIAGIAEPAAAIATLILLLTRANRSAAFWWTATAFIALAAMHGIFWFVTQPTNRFWLRNQPISKAGETFFNLEQANRRPATASPQPNWRGLRKKWEYSHIVRSALAVIALLSLVIAIKL